MAGRTRRALKRAKMDLVTAHEMEMCEVSNKVANWVYKAMGDESDDFVAEKTWLALVGDCKMGTPHTEFMRTHGRRLLLDKEEIYGVTGEKFSKSYDALLDVRVALVRTATALGQLKETVTKFRKIVRE
jgi:hypothetical protein